ncbi:MAG: ABC transporter ATP-binding protein, partial [Deltaproteobacteria bacterium]|nr:ABC transporter ATP-binding protein [Deltaproteobacteria bacterium]
MKPDQGQIWFHGEDISSWTQKALRPIRRQIQIVFQDPYGSLNPRMTVGQSVAEGFRTLGMPRGAERRNRLDELFEMVGISPASADRYPHEFSGGQRQRVGIARALSVSPSLVICDEPISALDVSIQAQIINLLKDLQEKLGLSYLFISHDLNVVGYLCHTIAVMYQGQIMEYGPTETIFERPSHPYTRSLLAAVPSQKGEFLPAPKSGTVDANTPTVPEIGCKYQRECSHETPTCRQDNISFNQVSPGHFVRCNHAPT